MFTHTHTLDAYHYATQSTHTVYLDSQHYLFTHLFTQTKIWLENILGETVCVSVSESERERVCLFQNVEINEFYETG